MRARARERGKPGCRSCGGRGADEDGEIRVRATPRGRIRSRACARTTRQPDDLELPPSLHQCRAPRGGRRHAAARTATATPAPVVTLTEACAPRGARPARHGADRVQKGGDVEDLAVKVAARSAPAVTPGQAVTWLYVPRGGYGFVCPVPATVV